MWQWYLIIEHIIWYIKSVCIVYMLVILIYTHINVQNNAVGGLRSHWLVYAPHMFVPVQYTYNHIL
jgi:hypothetical protein